MRVVKLGTLVLLLMSPFAVNAALIGVDAATDQLVSIDPATGAAVAIGSTGRVPPPFDLPWQPADLTFDGRGRLLGVDRSQDKLLTFDLRSGLATPLVDIGPLASPVMPFFDDITGIAFDPLSGRLFGTNTTSFELVLIDAATGLATALGQNGIAGSRIDALAFDASGTLFAVDRINNVLATLDTTNGRGTIIGALGFEDVRSLTFDGEGNLFGVDIATDQLLSIDPSTGRATAIGTVPFDGIFGLAYRETNVIAVSSPSTLALLIAGLVGLLVLSRPKRATVL